MRYTHFLAEIQRKNLSLKAVVLSLSILTLSLGLSCVVLALREPLLIERGCDLKSLKPVSSKRTQVEAEAFLKKVISIRFDTQKVSRTTFLSDFEHKERLKEQASLKRQQMIQRVLIDKIDFKKSVIFADRLIRVGDVRSVLPLRFKFSLKKIPRSSQNPYGLTLESTHKIN